LAIYREEWTLTNGKESRNGGSMTESAKLSTLSRLDIARGSSLKNGSLGIVPLGLGESQSLLEYPESASGHPIWSFFDMPVEAKRWPSCSSESQIEGDINVETIVKIQ
jgi:hypothetical protein